MVSIMFMPAVAGHMAAPNSEARPPPVITQPELLGVKTDKMQGKVAELRQELQMGGGKKDKNFSAKKIALKKIVANMTMSNNDMVALFPDIIGCMHIPSLEIKKMYRVRDPAGARCRKLTRAQVLLVPGKLCQNAR